MHRQPAGQVTIARIRSRRRHARGILHGTARHPAVRSLADLRRLVLTWPSRPSDLSSSTTPCVCACPPTDSAELSERLRVEEASGSPVSRSPAYLTSGAMDGAAQANPSEPEPGGRRRTSGDGIWGARGRVGRFDGSDRLKPVLHTGITCDAWPRVRRRPGGRTSARCPPPRARSFPSRSARCRRSSRRACRARPRGSRRAR